MASRLSNLASASELNTEIAGNTVPILGVFFYFRTKLGAVKQIALTYRCLALGNSRWGSPTVTTLVANASQQKGKALLCSGRVEKSNFMQRRKLNVTVHQAALDQFVSR